MISGSVVKFLTKNIMQIVQVDMNVGLAHIVANGREISSIIKTIYSNSAICTKTGEPFRFARLLVKLY